jgi:hypothetical protein
MDSAKWGAQLLIEQGHGVVLHARSEQRGKEALATVVVRKTSSS